MRREADLNLGCCEEFAELCALWTAEALNPEESRRLEEHLLGCRACSALLTDYRSLTSEGMAKAGASRLDHAALLPSGYDHARARARFESAMASGTNESEARPSAGRAVRVRMLSALGICAALVVTALAGYEFGSNGNRQSGSKTVVVTQADPALQQQLGDAVAQRSELAQKNVADAQAIAALGERIGAAEREAADLRAAKSLAEAKAADLAARNQQQVVSLASGATEQEMLQQKLRDSESALHTARQELTAALDDQQKTRLRTATLETRIAALQAEARSHEDSLRRSEQYLASDRDVRELMGARELYIADVFDVDAQGKTKKPYGRVFYTKGKSLIFYAFDLDQQPGLRAASAFQAWGRAGSSSATPVSLGIFYLDNESNRRWALKFEDPKVLEEVNAVFVTVEPQGGSRKPTNKPFLVAYLHTAPPNHP